jgi:hypothetical protein
MNCHLLVQLHACETMLLPLPQQSWLWSVMSKYDISLLSLHLCDHHDEHETLNTSWNNWNGTYAKCPYNSQTNLIIYFNKTTVLEHSTACQEYYVEPTWMKRKTSSCSLFCKESHLLEFQPRQPICFRTSRLAQSLSRQSTHPLEIIYAKINYLKILRTGR